MLDNFFFSWCLHSIETGKKFQSIWAGGHTLFEIFFFFNWNSKHTLSWKPTWLIPGSNTPCHPPEVCSQLAIGYLRPHGTCLPICSSLLEKSRLAKPNHFYYLNSNAYLDSKISVETQEEKSVFSFTIYLSIGHVAFKMKNVLARFVWTQKTSLSGGPRAHQAPGLVLPNANVWL